MDLLPNPAPINAFEALCDVADLDDAAQEATYANIAAAPIDPAWQAEGDRMMAAYHAAHCYYCGQHHPQPPANCPALTAPVLLRCTALVLDSDDAWHGCQALTTTRSEQGYPRCARHMAPYRYDNR